MSTRMPALFVSHGAPTLFIEPQPTRSFLAGLGATLPRPRAVLCISAHWTTSQPMVTATLHPETIHDFYGFPDELSAVRYGAPGSPETAARVQDLLLTAGIPVQADEARGLDHGAWVPLGLMYPQADVPVVQLSVQPRMPASHHLAVGRALAALRDEGVLILGSGGATHNLGDVRWNAEGAEPPEYVRAFDHWLKECVLSGREQDLAEYRTLAPFAADNHPTPEHYLPLLAPLASGGAARLAHEAFTFGVLSMAAFLWEN